MILVLVFAGLIALSVIQRQRFAPWIGLAGITVFGYLALSLTLQRDFLCLYRVVNGYVAFFFAVMLSVAGAIGIVVKIAKKMT